MDTELSEHEQQVLEANLNNPEALRIWGISSAKTGETVSFVLLVISIAATFVGTCCYFAFGNPAAIYLGTSGFCIVLALAIATVILRVFQRRLQHQDAARIGHELSRRLTGITQQDLTIQADVEEKMEWLARKLNIAGFMILLALGVIAYLNIMQGGGTDMERNIDLQRLHRRVRLRLHLAHDRLQCRNPHDRAQVPSSCLDRLPAYQHRRRVSGRPAASRRRRTQLARATPPAHLPSGRIPHVELVDHRLNRFEQLGRHCAVKRLALREPIVVGKARAQEPLVLLSDHATLARCCKARLDIALRSLHQMQAHKRAQPVKALFQGVCALYLRNSEHLVSRLPSPMQTTRAQHPGRRKFDRTQKS